jgi:hypothetical protein
LKAADASDTSLTAKVKQLVHKDSDPTQAVAKFRALGDEAVPILCSLVQSEAKCKGRLFRLFLGLTMFSYIARLFLIWAVPRDTRQLYEVVAVGLFGVGSLGNALMVFYGGRAMKLLAGLDDVRSVGPLLDAIGAHSHDGQTRASIRESLTRLLPRLQASDASLLLPRHISALNREIDLCRTRKWGSGDELAYALVAFKALEQVGDETSVPVVEGVYETTKNVKIRQAAEDCLPYLRQHAAMGRNTLLRAADPAASDLLLPAVRGGTSDPTVLLRPLSSGDDS